MKIFRRLEKLDSQSRLSLLEILEDRHGLASTIITSQIPIPAWHDIIGSYYCRCYM